MVRIENSLTKKEKLKQSRACFSILFNLASFMIDPPRKSLYKYYITETCYKKKKVVQIFVSECRNLSGSDC
jgi:hypothetical protein